MRNSPPSSRRPNKSPILTGVLTRLDGDQMTLGAADNDRIAVRTLTLDRPVSPEVTSGGAWATADPVPPRR